MATYDTIAGWMDSPFLDNPLKLWAIAFLTATGAFMALKILRRIALSRFRSLSTEKASKADGIAAAALGRTHVLFITAMSLLAGSLFLDLGPREALLGKAVVIVSLIQAGIWGSVVLAGTLTHWRERRLQDASSTAAIVAFGFLGKLAVWSIVVILALDNLGVEITALLAGLGVGGIAVALAVQNFLSDLLASFSIALDKPFEVGDFIIVGDLMGTVENIGLKTTRVRSLSGEHIIFSNTDLLSSRIRNFKRMFERRVVFSFGVSYETPREKLEKIPAMIRGIIEAQKDTRFDRAHFLEFGDSSFDFEAVYFVTNSDYNRHMDIRQAINLELLRRLEEEKIEMPYPTQMLLVRKLEREEPVRRS